MTETTNNYAEVLYGLDISKEAVRDTEELFRSVPKVKELLENPVVSFAQKERIISRIFPGEIQNFLKVVCRHHKIDGIEEIIEAYKSYSLKKRKILKAELYYVTEPGEEQQAGIRKFLAGKFSADEVQLVLIEKKDLIGGFVLQAGGREFDWSLLGRYRNLKQKLTRR